MSSSGTRAVKFRYPCCQVPVPVPSVGRIVGRVAEPALDMRSDLGFRDLFESAHLCLRESGKLLLRESRGGSRIAPPSRIRQGPRHYECLELA